MELAQPVSGQIRSIQYMWLSWKGEIMGHLLFCFFILFDPKQGLLYDEKKNRRGRKLSLQKNFFSNRFQKVLLRGLAGVVPIVRGQTDAAGSQGRGKRPSWETGAETVVSSPGTSTGASLYAARWPCVEHSIFQQPGQPVQNQLIIPMRLLQK